MIDVDYDAAWTRPDVIADILDTLLATALSTEDMQYTGLVGTGKFSVLGPHRVSREFSGKLYYRDEEGVTRFEASVVVVAVDREDAEVKAMDLYWDDRLDAASCTPYFEWDD
jgi:hypothetical protein